MIRSDYTRVWIPDKKKGWEPALLIQELNDGHTCSVKRIVHGGSFDQEGEVEEVDLRAFGEEELGGWDISDGLPLMNEETGPEGVPDMVNMGKLHEPGKIVIAVNPYRWLPELYGRETQATYVDAVESDVKDSLAPHVYSVSAIAMAELKKGKGQSILVSGESGAGKTETVKILISHLAFISSEMDGGEVLQERVIGNEQEGQIREDAASIITKIVNLNPLLEAFGNAKTVRNDNSSRFGKFMRLQMVVDDSNITGRMIGSRSSTYLLEKSRVVFHEPGERSFHIFYQLLAGAPADVRDACGLGNLTARDFSYLMAEGGEGMEMSGIIDGKSDVERFEMTCNALDLAGLSASEKLELFRGIAGCLFIGLLSFVASGDDEESNTVSCKTSLEPVVNILGLTSSKELEDVLTIRRVIARGEVIFTPNLPSSSANARDAMAKALYSTLFAWLVSRINRSTTAAAEDRVQRPQSHRGSDIVSYDGNDDGCTTDVNLLDIFGFETFKTNFFEQLLINYANEKLQQRFTLDVFKTQQQEYEAEGVPWSHIEYSDNSEVLWLIEAPSGVIGLLDEECVVPRGTDNRLASKLNSIHDEHVAFISAKPGHATEETFGIRHYAKSVVYTAKGMLEKNKDSVSESIIELLRKSNLEVIREAFSLPNLNDEGGAGLPSSSNGSSRHRRTQASSTYSGSRNLASTFKNSLANLMEAVNQTQIQYIRCIKPNETKNPNVLQPVKVISQLRCAGVIEAIRISRAAYTNRVPYSVLQSRFRMLAPGLGNKEGKYGSGSLLLEYLLPRCRGDTTSIYELGRTKVFFRAGALESLERRRRDLLCLKAIRIQAFYRMHVAQVRLHRAVEGVRLFQALTRGWQARRKFCMTMYRIVQIQCCFRMYHAKQVTQNLRVSRAATKIGALCRGRPMRIRFLLWRQSAITVQTWARGCLAVRHFTVAIREHREAQKLENQVATLQARLASEEEARLQLQNQLELSKTVESSPLQEEEPVMNMQFQNVNSFLPNEEFDAMLHESGVIIVALKREVMKLREQNEALKDENDDLKRERQLLMSDTSKFSVAAASHSVKRLTRTNSALMNDIVQLKEHCKKLQRQSRDKADEVSTFKKLYDNEVLMKQSQLYLIEDIAVTLSRAEPPIDEHGKGELVHYVNNLYRECMMATSHSRAKNRSNGKHSPTMSPPNVDGIVNSVTSSVRDSFNFFKKTLQDN